MDNEFNTAKKFPVYEQKEKSRRWSNCFGLVNKFKRLKNRLSTIQASDALRQPIPSSQQKSTRTLSNGMFVVYPRHRTPHYYHHRHAHSASTIATFSPQLSSVDSVEQQQQQQPSRALTPITAATYHLSLLSTTPSPSLSPPPRHGQIGRSRAFSDTSSSTHCCNDWRQFTTSYQKMTVRLSLDTESIYQQHRHQRHSNNDNTNDSSCMTDSPVDAVASVRDSMLIYQEDDVSTLRAHSNYSTISNTSSLTPQAPASSTATSPSFRSGTLGHPQTPKKQNKVPSLPSSATLQQYRQPLSSTITTASSNHRQSIGSSSRTSTLSSIDLPLKERRRRRSPLMFGENDRLTLPIPRNDMAFMQTNSNSNMDGAAARHSVISSCNDDHATKQKSRERAMQQLEGVSQSSTDGKIISMSRIASTKSLDEQLVAAGDPTLMMNKAHYDAVVSRTIQQRRPSSPMAYATTPPLLTQSAAASMTPPPSSSGLLNKNSVGTLSSSFLPTPSSSSSPPPPPPAHHTHYLAHPHHHPLPTTPNSLDSYL
ncbi:hypothetical protein [Absidia glauca]|uniref:Uncharacterized protein n=1 Tax=Absidia glauca TaxID=4829 RepID=A0A168S405_ABSGL|nr:hypothetical protein [Absidia glauca]